MKKALLRLIGFSMTAIACFTFGFAWRDLRHGELPLGSTFQSLVSSVSSKPMPSAEQMFRDTYNRILGSYVRPLKARDLKYAGIQGMMQSLGDPHTMFLLKKEADEFTTETRANLVGIGARLQGDLNGAKAARVFETGPAYRAGMRSGDVISQVNGKPMKGKSLQDIVDTIKGEEGTSVRLQIERASNPKTLSVVVRRSRVVIPTVDSQYLEASRMGYILVSTFSEPTAEQFDEELAKLERKKIVGLIIDVRHNPGGLLDSAREMLSRFAENRVVVKMKFRDGNEEIAKTYPGLAKHFGYPVAVLMNEDSASAAEIFAGALKDYNLATLVGTHSYGKASVQNVFPLVDGPSAKITIAKYYLPGGFDISRKVDEEGEYKSGGLEPDVKVEMDYDDDKVILGDPKTDPQLKRAIEVLQTKAR